MQDLDNTTFDRIVGQGLPVLVRIDKEYPYGDTDDAWKEVGVVRPTPTPPLPTTCTGWAAPAGHAPVPATAGPPRSVVRPLRGQSDGECGTPALQAVGGSDAKLLLAHVGVSDVPSPYRGEVTLPLPLPLPLTLPLTLTLTLTLTLSPWSSSPLWDSSPWSP